MADLTSIGVTSGVPSSGTGTVATINQLIAVGSPISNGSTTTPVLVNISGASSVVTSSMFALDVALSPNSAPITVASVSSIASIASLTSGTVFVSSGSLATVGTVNTVTSVSSGTVAIANGANTAAVTGASVAASSSMNGLVVSISPNSNGQKTMANSFPIVVASDQSAVPSYLTAVSSGGGLTVSSVIMTSGTNSTLVSSAARQLYKVECFNNSANIGYLHTYNLSSAPTAGSSLVFDRFLVPGNAAGAGIITTTDVGVPYTTGLSYTFTGGIADSDTTAVAASAFIVNLYYK